MEVKTIKAYAGITAENVRSTYRLETFNNFYKIKKEEPNLNQRQICEKLGITETSFKRLRQDFNIKSPYRHDISLKKAPQIKSGEGISCDICDKVCKNEKGLTTHKRIHKNQKSETEKRVTKKVKERLGFGKRTQEEIDKENDEIIANECS